MSKLRVFIELNDFSKEHICEKIHGISFKMNRSHSNVHVYPLLLSNSEFIKSVGVN